MNKYAQSVNRKFRVYRVVNRYIMTRIFRAF